MVSMDANGIAADLARLDGEFAVSYGIADDHMSAAAVGVGFTPSRSGSEDARPKAGVLFRSCVALAVALDALLAIRAVAVVRLDAILMPLPVSADVCLPALLARASYALIVLGFFSATFAD